MNASDRRARSADILIVTTTSGETKVLRRLATKAFGKKPERVRPRSKGYLYWGTMGDAEIYSVRTGKGSGDEGASLQTVGDAIRDLNPTTIILVGIAWGALDEAVDPADRQELYDILISTHVLPYHHKKVTTTKSGERKEEPRTTPIGVSSFIRERLEEAIEDWKDPEWRFHKGVILSGEEIVDNEVFREELLTYAAGFFGGDRRNTVGGEMEGAGLSAASERGKRDWIIVKGISDWGKEKRGEGGVEESDRQQKAAERSIEFVLNALKQGGFVNPEIRRTRKPIEEWVEPKEGERIDIDVEKEASIGLTIRLKNWIIRIGKDESGCFTRVIRRAIAFGTALAIFIAIANLMGLWSLRRETNIGRLIWGILTTRTPMTPIVTATGTMTPTETPTTVPTLTKTPIPQPGCSDWSIAITEIMFIPMPPLPGNIASGSANEYIELFNYGDEEIDVRGLYIADTGGHVGRLISWNEAFPGLDVGLADTKTTVLPGHGYALILPRYYALVSGPDAQIYSAEGELPAGTVLLGLAERENAPATWRDYLGNGLVATRGHKLDVVVLYEGTEDSIECVVSTYGSPSSINQGEDPASIQDDGRDAIPFDVPEEGGYGGYFRKDADGPDLSLNWQRFLWSERSPGSGPY